MVICTKNGKNMNSNSIDLSNILTEIKTVENPYLDQLKGYENINSILNEKDLIIKSKETKIAKLENEVRMLKDQIENLNNQKNNIEQSHDDFELNAPVHFVNFTKSIKSKSILSNKNKEKIESKHGGADFSHYRIDDVVVISVNLIRATLEKAIHFKDYLNKLIEKDSKLILDLSECVFLDSTFMGVIVSALKRSVSSNGDIRIVLDEETESVIFYVTRMDNVFKTYDSIDEAVNSYKNDA
jgi:anti-anti-sigma factor